MIRLRASLPATALAAIAALTGCRDILGFKESTALQALCANSDDCLPDESCAGQSCHRHCRTTLDCSGNESCVTVAEAPSLLCMAPDSGAPADAGATISPDAADAPMESPDVGVLEASNHADDDGPGCDADLTSDPHDCGQCGTACSAPNVCVASACHAIIYYGREATGDSSRGVAPETFVTLQIHITQRGWGMAIGLVTTQVNPDAMTYPHGFLGIYADTGGGSPGTLVAAVNGGSDVSTGPGRNEFPFSSPVLLEAGYYWLAAVFDGQMPFVAENGASRSWEYANLYSFGPLPATAPQPSALTTISAIDPNFYLALAQ
jgi:hypothetical protein